MPELMKGHVFADHAHKLVYPVRCEFKVDEVRVHMLRRPNGLIEYLSYAGKPLYNLGMFSEQLSALMHHFGLTELDCGFEAMHDFTQSKRWVRSSRGLPVDLAANRSDYRFILFDDPNSTQEYRQRCYYLATLTKHANALGLKLDRPEWVDAHDESDVHSAYAEARKRGFEGLMVKTYDHKYQRGKRIDGWLKYKPSLDEAGVVVAAQVAICGKDQPDLCLKKGDSLHRIGSITVRMPDGSLASPHGIPHDLGRQWYNNPKEIIGETVEFCYMERDTQGGYRHCTFWRVRGDV